MSQFFQSPGGSSGGATEAKQDDEIQLLTNIDDGITGSNGTNDLIGLTNTNANGIHIDTSAILAQTPTLIGGNVPVAEQFAATAEDNTRGVFATARRPLAVSTYCPSLFTNFGANATLNVKASPGVVFSLSCSNINIAVRYLQLHNTATVPSNGATPLLTFPVPLLTGFIIIGDDFFGVTGLYFSTGIAFAFSTTYATYTAGTASDQLTQIIFI